MKKRKTTSEILNDIDKRVEHLKKLDAIRKERKQIECSSNDDNMKDEEKSNGK